MNKKLIYLTTIFLSLFILSCDETPSHAKLKKDKLSGSVQKGPYVNGTSVTISELDSKLNATGRNFFTEILDNKGSFEIKNIGLISQYVELKADGFYFNEIEGKSSSAQLTLSALSDIENRSSINVNLLTHLEKSRVIYLIEEGLSFKEAKMQAQIEILHIFGFDVDLKTDSENLDISMGGEENAILLAISTILQGNRSVGNLTEMLANIGTDLRTDGELNSTILFDSLYEGAHLLRTKEIRTNLEFRYEQMGQAAVIPPFEKYIIDFLNPFEISYDITPINCNGAATGAINITVSGGTSPYSYQWSNGATTEDVDNLTAGEYAVTVFDSNKMRWTFDSLAITEASGLKVLSTIIDNSTSNGGSGSITISIEGGAPPYQYHWNDGSTDLSRYGLKGGKYSLTINDANGCNISTDFLIKNYTFISDDRDGNNYPTIQIGEDWWMAKNLDFNSEGSYYLNNDSLTYASQFGRLYSYPIDLSVCPAGWHVPTVYDFEKMIEFLRIDEDLSNDNGRQTAGIKLLNDSQPLMIGWNSVNDSIDHAKLNSSGFSALLGYTSEFDHYDFICGYWTQPLNNYVYGYAIYCWQEYEQIGFINSIETDAFVIEPKQSAFAIRCTKDK